MSPRIPEEVRAYLAKIGREGGKARSPAKTKAVRENAKKPRKYEPCTKPVPSRRNSKLHLFDRAGRCYGCGKTKGELATYPRY